MTGGCFGKTPLAADFVSVNAGAGAAYELQRWLLDGTAIARERTGSGWRRLYGALAPHRFFFEGSEGGDMLAGSLVRSTDRSGREFPIAVFTVLPAGDAAGSGEPTGLLEALERRAVDVAAGASGGAYATWDAAREAIDAAPPGPATEAPPDAAVDAMTVADVDGALGANGTVARVVGNLVELAHRTSRWEGWLPDFALRFPLPPDGDPAGLCRRFWTRTAMRALAARRRPGAFWTAGDGAGGRLDLHFQSPPPVTFLYLLDPELRGDPVYPVHETEAPPRYLAANPDVAAGLNAPGASLGDLDRLLVGALPPRPEVRG